MQLKAKPGVTGIGIGGTEYVTDEKGFVTIPDEYVPVALDNGFEIPAKPAKSAKE